MALVQDVAIVSDTEVAQISGEANLVGLDQGAATLASALVQSTNWLILWVRGVKQFDPAKLSNSDELKHAAAYHAAYLRLEGQPDPQMQDRAEKHKARRDEVLAMFVVVSSDVGIDETIAPKGLPVTLHKDEVGTFNRATCNRSPADRWSSRPSAFRQT